MESDRRSDLGPGAKIFAEYLVYLFFRLIEEFFCALSDDGTALSIGRFFGRVMFVLGGDRRNAAIAHLAIAFGNEWTPAQIRMMARKNFEHLGMLGVEFFRIRRWSHEKLAEKLVIEGKKNFDLAWSPGPKGIFYVTAHFGSFEVLAAMSRFMGLRGNLVITTTPNRFVNERMLFRRGGAESGLNTLPHRGIVRTVIDALRGGEMVVVLADQRGDDTRPVWVNYFGVPVLANGVFARFAAEGAAYTFPIMARRMADGRYLCSFGEEIPIQVSDDKEADIVVNSQRFHEVFEAWLREDPSQGFWMHRKFKRKSRRVASRLNADKNDSRLPSRIVLRGTNWVGDTVMSIPAARELRRMFPQAVIVYWGPTGIAPLALAAGLADKVISFGPEAGGPLRRPFRMRGSLVSGDFDMAVLFQNAFESAFTSWLAGIPWRAGYTTDLRGPLLNLKVPLGDGIRSKHQVFYYLALADFLEAHFYGNKKTSNGPPDCSVPIPEAQMGRAKNLLSSLGVSFDRPFFVLCPGSVNSEAKRWPADSFARLADLIKERLGGQVVFAGASGERCLIDEILSLTKQSGSVNIAGRVDIMDSLAVMRLSEMVISNDTGSAHLAVAARSLVLTIFGPTVPGATAPYGSGAHIIQGAASCAPCRHYRCPVAGHPCMRGVEPDAMLEKIEELLCNRD